MSNHELPDELATTAQRLRSERPELDARGLDRVHRRVAGRALRPAGGSRRSLAITLCLASGLLFTGAGSGLAVSGLASDGSAARVQYAAQQVQDDDAESPTIGESGSNGAAPGGTAPGGDHAVRQVEAVGSGGKLPFTGSASLLILGLGGVLLVTGAVLRRRTMHGHHI